MQESDRRALLPADNPISTAEEDRLGRDCTAKRFVRQILEIDTSEGLTVGVFGPWGSGKTSFFRLAKAKLKLQNIPVIEFNPWMFSGTEQLVARLFDELAASLGQEDDGMLKKAAGLVAEYGEVVVGAGHLVSLATAVPGVPAALKPILAIARKWAAPVGLAQAREKLEGVLCEREVPIVVVLDDVDRLTMEEIRHLFKLLRLTASFPHLVYIVLCDRERVEQALEDGNPERGRHYLEKIIQLQFDLPAAPRQMLREQLEEALTHAMPEGLGPINADVWQAVYRDIVEHLIRNLRDVRRYVTTARGTATALARDVEVSDILGLEAVRLFLPDVFKHLHAAADALTFPSHSSAEGRDWQRLRRAGLGPDPVLQERLRKLVDAGNEHRHVVKEMLKHLFPYGLQYLEADEQAEWTPDHSAQGEPSERRVADESILRHYLERVAGPDLVSLRGAERALSALADGAACLDAYMRGLDPDHQIAVVRDFCGLHRSFERKHVEPGVMTLLNLLPDMPDDPRLVLSGRRCVRNAVYHLLTTLDGHEEVEHAATKVLPQIQTLGSKAELVSIVATPAQGEELVSEDFAGELRTAFAEDIRDAFDRDAIDEIDRYSALLAFAARAGTPVELPDTAEVAFRVVHSSIVDYSVNDEWVKRLDWERIDLLYGDRDTAERRVRQMCADFDERVWKPRLKQWLIPMADAEATLEVARRSLERGSAEDRLALR